MAKNYKIIKRHNYPERIPELLSHQPAEGNASNPAPYDLNAPGLYPNETVVEIAGEQVAVSVDAEWLPNNSGVALHGFARWLNADGSTKESELGHPLETSISNTFDNGWIDKHGLQALTDATMKMVLGEPLPKIKTKVDKDVVAGKRPGLPPGTEGTVSHDSEQSEVPLIMAPEELLMSANIAVAIDRHKKLRRLSPKL